MFLGSTISLPWAFGKALRWGPHRASGTTVGKGKGLPRAKEVHLMEQHEMSLEPNSVHMNCRNWRQAMPPCPWLVLSFLPTLLPLLQPAGVLMGISEWKSLSLWDELQCDYNRLSDLQFGAPFIILRALQNYKWHTVCGYILFLLDIYVPPFSKKLNVLFRL